jgi:hypothetical protein
MDEIAWQDRGKAALLPLRGGPRTKEAEELVGLLVQTIAPASGLARPSFVERYRKAIGAFLADLLSAAARGRGGKRSMSANDFSLAEDGFGYDVFRNVVRGCLDLELIDVRGGWKRVTTNAFDTPGFTTRTGGDYTFFRPTPTLFELVEEHGALPFQDHWRTGRLPLTSKAPVLELRAAKRADQRQGALISYDPDEKTAAHFLRDLEEMNAFLLAADFGGIAHNGLKRVFNDGDLPGQRWRRGGRFYSRRGGDRYEAMDGDERRSLITINGEGVAEVDISAAHLTEFYALKRLPFDAMAKDPYGSGPTRLPFKLLVASAFGKGSVQGTRWSPRSGILYREAHPGRTLADDFPYAEIKQLVLSRHPILGELSATGLVALDFQFHESEIIRAAMMFLRQWRVASLPVHDSLIVPVSKVAEAVRAIEKGFILHFRGAPVKPRLSVKGLGGRE